jgi:DMSO/TMAO reductase YedYZ molybdopterin-dependent catalytic subunit
MPHQTLTVTNPHTQKQEKYEGVPLRALLDRVGVPSGEKLRGPEMRSYLIISAKDGYEVVLTLVEIDPTFQQNQVLVADTLDGKPLDDKHGPLQLVVPEDRRPARWVRMISKISVRQAPRPRACCLPARQMRSSELRLLNSR